MLSSLLASAEGDSKARVEAIEGLRKGSRRVVWRIMPQECSVGEPWSVGEQTFQARFRVLPPPVFAPRDCTKPRQRPKRIVIACADFYMFVARIHWGRWGGPRAKGRGILRAKTCIPDCATSGWEQFRVRVRLRGIRVQRCGGRRVRLYQHLVLTFPNKRPPYHTRVRRTALYCVP